MPRIRRHLFPLPGRITTFQAPGGTGVRVDSAAYADAVIPPYYDSMIAKLIVKGRDRAEAIGRMKRALEMFVIEGIKTSIPLHRRILSRSGVSPRAALIRTLSKDCSDSGGK